MDTDILKYVCLQIYLITVNPSLPLEADACVEPVLSMEEASDHSHNTQRQVFHKHSSGEFEPSKPRLIITV